MRSVLLLCGSQPSTTGAGARMRAGAWLKALAKNFDVHLVVLETGLVDEDSSLMQIAKTVTRWTVDWPSASHAGRSIGEQSALTFLAEALVHPPEPLWRPTKKELADLAAHLPLVQCDLVLAVRLRMAVLADRLIDGGFLRAEDKAYDLDDRESEVASRMCTVSGKRLGRAMSLELMLRAWRLHRWERRLCRDWRQVFVCSDNDRAALSRHCGARVRALPNTLPDPGQLQPQDPAEALRLLFVGSLAYPPNSDGIEWFVTEIMPQLRERLSRPVTLQIVGRSAPLSVRKLATLPGVSIHQDVAKVVPYYVDADLVVVPLRFGGGTRIKIIEAMALGRPVVSTPIGAEGLQVIHGQELMLADQASSFAEMCLMLADDPGRCASLVRIARDTYLQHYTPIIFERAVAGALCQQSPD